MPEFELADYSILEKIGEGSFSEVFRVKHKRTGFYYAAKKLTKLYFDPAEALQDSEIRVMKLLDYHPNVLSFVDILHDQATGSLSLIMELMDMSMYDYIKNRKRCLSEKRVKRYLYQMVCGLHHLHRNGIFHRDIKPENVLIKIPRKLKENELVQLADFGSICSTSQQPPYSAYISTRWYRSPECLLTSGYYGPKMDIWAVGCCFYEMLTLNPLFPGENELDQLYLIHEIVGSPSAFDVGQFPQSAGSWDRRSNGSSSVTTVSGAGAGGKQKLSLEMLKHKNLERVWGMADSPGKARLVQQIHTTSSRLCS
ncbi:rage-1 [Culex quinquefasciatus]|uniref:Rage-1 n=1 Tax=Culex quinquefasciatus TaxID=7176 RepID=B0X116_CULQU|nr:rage-1 [Culex quinquefasciatus]|eukprot:XP_001863338.1 rage-1 [Culex quinquefasciatus]